MYPTIYRLTNCAGKLIPKKKKHQELQEKVIQHFMYSMQKGRTEKEELENKSK